MSQTLTQDSTYTTLIAEATEEFPRISEADAIELKDGRLLLGVSRKPGGSDHSPGEVIGLHSEDGGRTWSDEPTVIQSLWDGVTDIMSVSLLRTSRGIHLFFIGRVPLPNATLWYENLTQIISSDEGLTWSAPERNCSRVGYQVLNNARSIRTASGRIILLIASFPGPLAPEHYDKQVSVCLYSDDEGRHWQYSEETALEGTALMEPGVA